MIWDQAQSLIRAVADHLVEMSGNWIGAIAVSALGSIFAAGRAVLNATPMTRALALRDEAQGRGRAALSRYIDDPPRTQSRWLFGRITCTALAAALIADAVARMSLRWVVVVVVLGTLVTYGAFTQISTNLARRNADRSLVMLLRVLRPFELLVIPIAAPFAALSNVLARLLPAPAPIDGRTTEHEVEMLLAEGAKAGTLGEERAEMIQNVLEFDDKTAGEVMIPRTSLTAIAAGTTLDDVLKTIISKGHSRYPVYRDSIDNIIGLLYAKDLFRVMGDPKSRSRHVEQFVRSPVNFVPETQPVSSLLREMRARRLHMAVVVDDYGGVSGVVTLEDIVEQIVGDIQDEHDVERNPVVELGDGRLLVDAAMPVDDLERLIGVAIPDGGDFVSVGGLLVHQAGHVPEPGRELEAFGVKFIVREADERKISKVEVHKPEPVSEDQEETEATTESP